MTDYKKKLNSGETLGDLALKENAPAMNKLLSNIEQLINTIKLIEKQHHIGLIPIAIAKKNLTAKNFECNSDLENILISDLVKLLQNLNKNLKENHIDQQVITDNLNNLKKERDIVKNKISTIREEIDSNSLEIQSLTNDISNLGKPPSLPPLPSELDRFLADEKPGFFKSIAMWVLNFFSSIDDSKKKCSNYNSANTKQVIYTERIEVLEEQIMSLEGDNTALYDSLAYLSERKGDLAKQIKGHKDTSETCRQLDLKLKESMKELKKNMADSTAHCNTSLNLSAGDRKFNVFLGLSFNSFAI